MADSAFLLVATVGASDANGYALGRLIGSLGTQDVAVELHVVVRGPARISLAPPSNVRLEQHAGPRRLGLSAARNVVLRRIRESVAPGTVVAFPDDDCWYPAGLLQRVSEAMVGGDIVTGSYGADPSVVDTDRFGGTPGVLDWTRAYAETASVTQFFKARVIADVGLFDERFGVGGRFPSGEDADYLVRAVERGWRCFHDPALVVGHLSTAEDRQTHFVGGLALLGKHAAGTSVARKLLVRRVVAGGRGVVAGSVPPRIYAAGLSGAFGCWKDGARSER